MAIPAPFTDQQIANQLTRDGTYWYGDNGDGIVKYSFSSSYGDWWPSISGESALNATQQQWVRTAFDQLSEMFSLTFQEVSQPSNTAANPPYDVIQFTNVAGTGTFSSSYSYTSGPNIGGVAFNAIVLDSTWNSNQAANLDYGSYGYMTILHEILHSLGLEHPGSYNAGSGSGPITYQNDAEFEQDTHRYTIMSYFNASEDGSGAVHYDVLTGQYVYPRTPMVYDILAMTQGNFAGNFGGYSQNSTTRNTDTTYGYNVTPGTNEAYDFAAHGAPVLTIYDTGGTDTLDLSGDTVSQQVVVTYDAQGVPISQSTVARTETLIDIREGQYSSTHGMTYNIGIAIGTVIENVVGTQFNDTVHGNDVANTIQGNLGDDVINGYAGRDKLYGGDGVDTLNGGDDEDALFGEDGDDTLNGGNGEDGLIGGQGADDMDGGSGIDTAYYFTSSSGVDVDLTRATQIGGDAQGDTLQNIENISGTNYADTLSGDSLDNLLYGLSGNDRFYGRGGNDTIYGDNGNDALFGEDGDDLMFGGDGNDGFIGGAGADNMVGGDGMDTAYYFTSSSGLDIDLTRATQIGGDAQGDKLSGIENVSGTQYADIITGDTFDNWLYGLRGDDRLDGGGGDDRLYGEEGRDVLYGGNGLDQLFGGDDNDALLGGIGADYMDGGDGTDYAYYFTSTSGVDVDLTRATQIGGDAQGDQLVNIENVSGSQYADSITGDQFDNVLYGLSGIDTLKGGLGNDTLFGGADGDIFLFDDTRWGNDTIMDFQDGVDLISFVGSGLTFGDLTISSTASGTQISYFDGSETSTIVIEGLAMGDLTASDFLFA